MAYLNFTALTFSFKYPAYDSFLASVQVEAEQNVKRLRHHPSVVIFSKVVISVVLSMGLIGISSWKQRRSVV